MDNKEKVEIIEQLIVKVVKRAREGNFIFDFNSHAEQVVNELFPKVKLPQAAYEWMEQTKDTPFTQFENRLYSLATSVEKFTEGFRIYFAQSGSLFKLADAYRYGYELEETEEERIKRDIRETLHNGAGVMISNELVDRLYNIAKGKSNV